MAFLNIVINNQSGKATAAFFHMFPLSQMYDISETSILQLI